MSTVSTSWAPISQSDDMYVMSAVLGSVGGWFLDIYLGCEAEMERQVSLHAWTWCTGVRGERGGTRCEHGRTETETETTSLTYASSRVCSTADCMWTDKLKSSLEKLNFGFSLPFSSQSILYYAYALDVLIPHFVHMTYFDYTLPILQKRWENEMCQWTSFKLSAIKLFSQSFGELTRCSQNMLCGQCEVSKCLAYRHILKIYCEETGREKPKIHFFGTWINLYWDCSLHAICSGYSFISSDTFTQNSLEIPYGLCYWLISRSKISVKHFS